MKMLLATSAFALIGVFVQKPLAQAVNVDPLLSGWSELGAVSVLGTIVMVLLLKVMPQMSADAKEAAIKVAVEDRDARIKAAEINAAANKELSDEMRGVRTEIKAGNDSQLGLLRALVQNTKGSS